MWKIECDNEMCGGTIQYVQHKPGNTRCPRCGWLAMHGSGIKHVEIGPLEASLYNMLSQRDGRVSKLELKQEGE